ncbi:hypothetical protein QYF36_005816 [Acer negundo]|nr:hypothetical protein QYF36_005816 [Acer negundo]
MAREAHAGRKICVEEKQQQPSSFPSLPGPGPKAVQSFLAKSRAKGGFNPYSLSPQANGALLFQGGEPQEALLRGRSLAPLHSLQGSKPFFNIGDNERRGMEKVYKTYSHFPVEKMGSFFVSHFSSREKNHIENVPNPTFSFVELCIVSDPNLPGASLP